MFLAADDRDGDEAAGKLECSCDGLLEPRGDSLLDEQAVHDDLDGVILPFIESGKIIHGIKFAIDAHTHVAILAQFFEFFAVRAFAASNDWRKDHDAVVGLRELTLKNCLN